MISNKFKFLPIKRSRNDTRIGGVSRQAIHNQEPGLLISKDWNEGQSPDRLQGRWAVKRRNKVLFAGSAGCHNTFFKSVIESHEGGDRNIIFHFAIFTMRCHGGNVWKHVLHQNVVVSVATVLPTDSNTVSSGMVKRPLCRQRVCRDANPVHHGRKVIARPGRGLLRQSRHLDAAAGLSRQGTG